MSAVIFAYHPSLPIKGTLHYYELTEDHTWIKDRYFTMVQRFKMCGQFGLAKELKIIEDVPVTEIQKMLDATGYVATWYEKNIIGEQTKNV